MFFGESKCSAEPAIASKILLTRQHFNDTIKKIAYFSDTIEYQTERMRDIKKILPILLSAGLNPEFCVNAKQRIIESID